MNADEQVLSQPQIKLHEFRRFVETLPTDRNIATSLGGTYTEPMPLRRMLDFADRFPGHYDVVDMQYQRTLVELRKTRGWLLCKFGEVDGSAFSRLSELESGALLGPGGHGLLQAFRKFQVDLDLGLEKRMLREFLSSFWVVAEDIAFELRQSHPLTSGMIVAVFKSLRQALDAWNVQAETIDLRVANWTESGIGNAARGAVNTIASNALIDIFNNKAISNRNAQVERICQPVVLQMAAICSANKRGESRVT